MKNVLIIGGGLAGCTVAKALSDAGLPSTIVEKTPALGGKIRTYGCKADSVCNNCGLCAVGSLWQDVENDPGVKKLLNARVFDITGSAGDFLALVKTENGFVEEPCSGIVVASGFEDADSAYGAAFQNYNNPRVFTGNALESLLKNRSVGALLPEPPKSAAFILCYGSRTLKDRCEYCSQICCAYSTRAAKVIKHYYPDAEVVMFYMDIQAVNPGNYLRELENTGIKTVRCRPADISFNDALPVVSFENENGKQHKTFDYLFLANGIRPDIAGNTMIADLTGLRVKENGFIDYVKCYEETGVYIAGTASGPANIYNVIADAKNIAAALVKNVKEGCVL